jgi:hypothetical protein
MTDRVDAVVEQVQAPDRQAMIDAHLFLADPEQLSARYHPVLPPRQLRNRSIQDP